MTFKEVQGDLFTAPAGVYLAHCISADFAMGKGIAVEFNKRYNMRERLKAKYPNYLDIFQRHRVGGVCILEDNVFNLITKEHYWEKPTIITLRLALVSMKEIALRYNITAIAMPMIGAGLDRLSWGLVKQQIEQVFNDTNIDITVYRLGV